METNAGTSGRRPVRGAVRGAFRSALLGWTDPESGARLRVQVRGECELVESLEPLGFELLDHADDPGQAERGSGRRVVSSFFRAQLERRAQGLAPRPGGLGEGPAVAG